MMLKTQRNLKQKMMEEEEKKIISGKPKISKRKSELLFTRLYRESIKREESLEKGRIRKKLKDSKIISEYFVPTHHIPANIPSKDHAEVFQRLQKDILHRIESLLIKEKPNPNKSSNISNTKKVFKTKRNSVISQYSSTVFDVKNSKFVTVKNSPSLQNKFLNKNEYHEEKNGELKEITNNSLEGLKAIKLCNLI